MGLRDATQNEHGIVLATVPGNVPGAPTIALIAHVDTSPETTGKNVKPQSSANYAGGDIVLPGDPIEGHPRRATTRSWNELRRQDDHHHRRHDAARRRRQGRRRRHHGGGRILLSNPEIPHGPVRVCFTCDEEIGHGVDHLDLKETRGGRWLHARRRRHRRDRRRDVLRRPGAVSRSPASTSTRRSPRGGWSTRSAWPGCSWTGCRSAALSPGDDRRPRGLPAPLHHRGRRRRR